MKTYKFDTRISKTGIIEVPLNLALYNREVEVVIIPKAEISNKLRRKAADFLEKWAGFLKNDKNEDSKYNYLMDKYK